MRKILKRDLLAGASAAATLMACEAAAQVDVVTVTAERREASVQDVPVAVTAFSEADLQRLQIDEPLDLIEYVPNMIGSNNTGLGAANAYYLRGLGNTETIATFDPPIGTYVDEVYVARQNANNVAFFDVERIEVLRGPQGTLFGRNTTGGAVSLHMRRPADSFGGFAEIGYGSYERFMARGSVDLPVHDQLLTKVSAFVADEEGFVDNLTTGETLNGQEAVGARLDLTWLASDTVSWELGLEAASDSGMNLLNYVEGAGPLSESPESGDRVSRTGLSTRDGSGSILDQILAGQGLGNDNDTFAVTSNFEVESLNGAFNFITAYRRLEQVFILDFFDGGLGGEGFATGGFVIGNDGLHEQISQEIKYAGSFWDGRVDLVAGAFYFAEDNVTEFVDVFTLGLVPGGFPLTLANRRLENTLDSAALYGQFDLNISDRLTLTAGARWTEERKEVEFTDLTGATGPATLDTANLQANGIPTEQVTALITPRLAAEFQLNPDIMLFASVTEGFKSGGWNARGTAPGLLQPFRRELARSWEAGVRSQLFDDRLRVNATAFFMDIEDYQAPSAFVGPGGAITFITLNEAGLENRGLELEIAAAPVDGLDLFAAIGLQDAEYVDLAQSVLDQQADCQAGLGGGGLGVIAPDCSIGEPVRAPDLTATFGAAYQFMLTDGLYLTPTANARYQGEMTTGTSNLPNAFTDGLWLVNAGFSLGDTGRDLEVVLECTNCLDEIYVQSNLPPTVYINEPRRWMLSLRKGF